MDINLKGAERLTFVGTATSHFQAQPRMETITLDWEHELDRNLRHQDSHIHRQQHLANLPHLLDKTSSYADRSLELGMNMFRFSIELGRLAPCTGQFNEDLMAQYVGLLAELVYRKQTPMITLQHYTMPKDLCQFDARGNFLEGAWESPFVIQYLTYAVKKVIEFLNNPDKVRAAIVAHTHIPEQDVERMLAFGLVSWFITINEPIMTALHGYVAGLYPPFQKKGLKKAWSILKRIVEAHDVMYDMLKQPSDTPCGITNPKVGVAHNWTYLDGPLGWPCQKIMNEWFYSDQFERNGNHSDFLGIQYYFRETPPFFGKKWPKRIYPDHPGFGDVYPRGLLGVLKRMHRAYPKKDIIVTEFGFPDDSDKQRPYWTMRTFIRIVEAIRLGIPVKGVLHWSLVDNFEWDWGMDKFFGLMSERETERPLRLDDSLIRGWQAWKVCANVALRPSPRSEDNFKAAYKRAEYQFREYRTEKLKH